MTAAKKLHHLNAWERSPELPSAPTIASGIPGLDDLLPGGGWPETGLVEILSPNEYAGAVELVVPLLEQLGTRSRWLGLVAPPCGARARLLGSTAINPLRMQQVNPHAGRSDLWSMEHMLQGGDYSVVLGWPGCATELVNRRLQRAAGAGASLGVLFRYERFSAPVKGSGLRLQLEVSEGGRLVYLLNGRGQRISDAALIGAG